MDFLDVCWDVEQRELEVIRKVCLCLWGWCVGVNSKNITIPRAFILMEALQSHIRPWCVTRNENILHYVDLSSVPFFPVWHLTEPHASDKPWVIPMRPFLSHSFQSQMCLLLPWSSLNEQNAFPFHIRLFLMNSMECNILCNKNDLLPDKSFWYWLLSIYWELVLQGKMLNDLFK